MSETPISPLRARLIEDMSVRKFGEGFLGDLARPQPEEGAQPVERVSRP